MLILPIAKLSVDLLAVVDGAGVGDGVVLGTVGVVLVDDGFGDSIFGGLAIGAGLTGDGDGVVPSFNAGDFGFVGDVTEISARFGGGGGGGAGAAAELTAWLVVAFV
jgi:hypothetical protein